MTTHILLAKTQSHGPSVTAKEAGECILVISAQLNADGTQGLMHTTQALPHAFFYFVLCCFETRSCHAAQAYLKLDILQFQPFKCWDYRREL
jgi:hypothetical protein